MVSQMLRLTMVSKGSPRMFGYVLADAVEDDDRILNGESNHGQDGRQEQGINLPAEQQPE